MLSSAVGQAVLRLQHDVDREVAREESRTGTLMAPSPSVACPVAGSEDQAADEEVVALDGLEAGQVEVLVDDWSRTAKAGVAQEPAAFYAEVAAVMG